MYYCQGVGVKAVDLIRCGLLEIFKRSCSHSVTEGYPVSEMTYTVSSGTSNSTGWLNYRASATTDSGIALE